MSDQKDYVSRAHEVFDRLIDAGKRKRKPWRQFIGPTAVEYYGGDLDRDEWMHVETLATKYRHGVFARLARRFQKADGFVFDAWGPFDLPSFQKFFRRLSVEERGEFTAYVERRKLNTIDIETDFQISRRELTWTALYTLLGSVTDNRQRFRLLACVVEYLPLEETRLGERHIEQIRAEYETLRETVGKRLSLAYLIEQTASKPLPWLAHPDDLVTIMNVLREAGPLKGVTYAQIAAHFDWEGKYGLQDPGKRLRERSSESKGSLRPRSLIKSVAAKLRVEVEG